MTATIDRRPRRQNESSLAGQHHEQPRGRASDARPQEEADEEEERGGRQGRQRVSLLPTDRSDLSPSQKVFVMGLLAAPVIWALLVLACRVVDARLAAFRERSSVKCVPATFRTALPPNAQITNITFVPKGGAAGEGPSDIQYPTVPNKLPELCAVTVQVTSSPSSSYRFGIFLPSSPHQWKGRFLTVGNGGFGGGINWLDMAPGPHYGMATISTDTGHNSSVEDITWANDEPEMRTDWGWRGLHGSIEIGKKMTEAFYGKPIKYSYYNGCSTGGRQGLKELQISPESFDGALIGAPSWYVKHINVFVVKFGLYNLPVTADHYIPVHQFSWMGDRVMEQCDEVDGVKDGIISSPELCVFDFSKIRCPFPQVTSPTCLTDPQIETAKKIYGDSYEEDGKFIYTGLTYSSEDQWNILLGADAPSPFGVQYVQDFLLNDPSWDWQTYNDSLIQLSERLDPGGATAAQFDIHQYRDRGGKIILYHGLADGLVATRGSTLFYNETVKAMGDVDDWFRYFQIPGMQHCWNTTVDAPWNMAGAYQPGSIAPDEWSVPGFKNSRHDAVLALVDWVEKQRAVNQIIATTWHNPEVPSTGVLRQRPLCPYPKKAVYGGRGNVNHATSWSCK